MLSLGTGGCNLACPFCQNHALSQWSGLPPGEPFAVKSIADELRRRNLDAVAFTHPHADHMHGLDDIRQITFNMHARLPVWADEPTTEALINRFGYA
ncbi:MAG: MBL fold metallo-hydrolase, partial [Synergistales bacterium]|nr:MBL fold metallo-hydrolase [Synergistales bacterium]